MSQEERNITYTYCIWKYKQKAQNKTNFSPLKILLFGFEFLNWSLL